MTHEQDIHRLKLAIDNRAPRMPRREPLWSRLAYLGWLCLAATFTLGCWWGIAVVFLSLEKVMR